MKKLVLILCLSFLWFSVFIETHATSFPEWTDVDTYQVLDEKLRITKDKNHVYRHWKILEGTDTSSFNKAYKEGVFYDKDTIYYIQKHKVVTIPGGDVETFEVMSLHNFYKDKNHIYHKWSILLWADAKTFAQHKWWYFIDKDSVFYLYGQENIHSIVELQWVDATSFENISDGYFWDKNHVIYAWNIIASDPQWFKKMDDLPTHFEEKVLAENDQISCILQPGFGGILLTRQPRSYQSSNWDIFIEWINTSHFSSNDNKQILEFPFLATCFHISWDRNKVYTTIPITVGFTPERQEKIDAAMTRFVRTRPKNNLEIILKEHIASTKEYKYGSRKELIIWTFYRHILKNLNMYYTSS